MSDPSVPGWFDAGMGHTWLPYTQMATEPPPVAVAGPEKIVMTSAWGATETAPMATQTPSLTRRAGAIGLPVPGTELKLCPLDDKTEVRVRGPNVTPGYWKQPELTESAFDEEGFYRMGDAVRLAAADDPVRMAHAMRHAIVAGRLAFLAGRMPSREIAVPSSPTAGMLD